MRWTTILALLGLVLFATGCAEDDEKIELAGGTVKYDVVSTGTDPATGATCTADIVYLIDTGAVVEAKGHISPFTHSFVIPAGERAVYNLYISGRNVCAEPTSTVTATIFVDDVLQSSSNGAGNYAWASATGTF